MNHRERCLFHRGCALIQSLHRKKKSKQSRNRELKHPASQNDTDVTCSWVASGTPSSSIESPLSTHVVSAIQPFLTKMSSSSSKYRPNRMNCLHLHNLKVNLMCHRSASVVVLLMAFCYVPTIVFGPQQPDESKAIAMTRPTVLNPAFPAQPQTIACMHVVLSTFSLLSPYLMPNPFSTNTGCRSCMLHAQNQRLYPKLAL